MGLASPVVLGPAVCGPRGGTLAQEPTGSGHSEQWPSYPRVLRPRIGPPVSRASSPCTCLSPTALPSAGTGRALGTHSSAQEGKPQLPPPPCRDEPTDMAISPRGPRALLKPWVPCPVLGLWLPAYGSVLMSTRDCTPAFSSF